MFPVGSKILVKRSSGAESLATVDAFDSKRGVYTVALAEGGKKGATVDQIRLAP